MTTYDDLTLEQAGLAYLTGTTFTDEAFFHAAAAKLRAEDPIHWVEHPDFEREVRIVRMRVPQVLDRLARQVAGAVEALRTLNLYKPPGVAETIDWAQALAALGRTELDEAIVEATLGAVLKYREDQDRTRQHGIADLVKQAFERGFQSS